MRGDGSVNAPRSCVVLVREAEEQLSSSGCCGRLEGDFLRRPDGERAFPERRAAVEALGPLYQSLRARYGNTVDIHVIDPRSFVTLIPLLLRDFWRHGVGVREALRTLTGTPVRAVIVNGRLVAGGAWPAPDLVFEAVDRSANPVA